MPEHKTLEAINVATGKAYDRTVVRKIKSKIGFTARRNAKTVAKKAFGYGIGKIPFVGSELKAIFDTAMNQGEQYYKRKKAEKYANEEQSAAGIKATLKSMTISNALEKIDGSFKKVRMSADECTKISGSGMETCAQVCERFYHLFRLQYRVEKCRARSDAVIEMLTNLNKQLDEYNKAIDANISSFIPQADDYFRNHIVGCEPSTFSTSSFKNICLADTATLAQQRTVESRIEKSPLMQGQEGQEEFDYPPSSGEKYSDIYDDKE